MKLKNARDFVKTLNPRYIPAVLIQVLYIIFAYNSQADCLNGELGTFCCGGDYRFTCVDFGVFYFAAKQYFFPYGGTTPALIYDYDTYMLIYAAGPFRYFPLILYVIYPLLSLSVRDAWFVWVSASALLNIATAFVMAKILKKLGLFDRKGQLLIFIYLIMPFHVDNFAQGQVASFVCLPLTASLYYYLQRRDFVASVLLSLSLAIKPVTFFVIFFVLLKNVRNPKQFFRNAAGLVLAQTITICAFLFQENLLSAYIKGQMWFANWGTIRHVISTINVAAIIAPNYVQLELILFVTIFTLISTVKFFTIKDETQKVLFSFFVGVVLLFVCITDIWISQAAYLFPVLLIYLCLKLRESGAKKNLNLIFLCGFYACVGLIILPVIFQYRYTDINTPLYWVPLLIIILCDLPPLFLWVHILKNWKGGGITRREQSPTKFPPEEI